MSGYLFRDSCPVCREEGLVLDVGGTTGTEEFEQSRRFDKVCFSIDTAAYIHIVEGDSV